MKLRRPRYTARRRNPVGFAWLPKRLRDGTIIWLERYRRRFDYPTERRP